MSTKPLNSESEKTASSNIGEEIRKELEKRGFRVPTSEKMIAAHQYTNEEGATAESNQVEEMQQEALIEGNGSNERVYTADGKGELVAYRDHGQPSVDRDLAAEQGVEKELYDIEHELMGHVEDEEVSATSNLVVVASHELRTPLQAVTGFLELLHSRKVTDARKVKHFLDIAYQESQYLTSRVADLEVASLIEAGLFRIKSDPVLMNQTIKSCVQSLALQFGDTRIHLNEAVLDDLPTIFGDEVRIRQALVNLIETAVRFVQGTGVVQINAGVEQDDLWISVECEKAPLREDGTPPAEEEEHGPFGGTGSNLAIFVSRHIVEAHGGRLVIQEAAENELMQRMNLPLSMERKSRGTILITEDNQHAGMLLEFALEQEGFNPIRANSGSETLEIVAGTSVDLIILDVVLPGMDGFEVCQRLRSSPETASIPIVMTSAMAREENQFKALSMGANIYFQKPLSLSELIPVVEHLIEDGRDDAA
jgi:CheY-like chemotaxis protein